MFTRQDDGALSPRVQPPAVREVPWAEDRPSLRFIVIYLLVTGLACVGALARVLGWV